MKNLLLKTQKMFLALCVIGFSSAVLAAPPAIWGSKHVIPYMPYSDSASQRMYVTNPTSSEVTLTVTAFDEKGSIWDLGEITAGTQKVTKVTSLIQEQLRQKGFTEGTLNIEFIINSPDVIIYSSYYASSIRGYVPVVRTYLLTNPNS